MILLDTDVVSGLMRQPRDALLVSWLSKQVDQQLATSVITLAEISFGLQRLPIGRRSAEMQQRFDSLLSVVRLVDVDAQIARKSASFRSQREISGRPIALADALIAATASVLELELATRNIRDFEGLGLRLSNPWA